MKSSEKYTISFGGLSKGIHEFRFEIKDEFFEKFEHSIVQKASAEIVVTLEKTDIMLLLGFNIKGFTTVPCDRCLEELNVEVEGYNELLIKFGVDKEEESDDVIVLPVKAHQLDVSQFIYEYFSMLIPLRNIHPDDEAGNSRCNPEALKEIERYKQHEIQKPIDPRWEELKKLNPN